MIKNSDSAPHRDTVIENYLKEKQIDSVTLSPEGVYYVIEEEGEGRQVQKEDFVSVHYTGKLLNGTKFDSSFDRNEPIQFQIGVGNVIPGWDIGIPLFKVGGKGSIFIPSGLAYGEAGAGGVIPPNAPLRFDIEVVDAMDYDSFLEYRREVLKKQQEEAQAKRAEQAKIDQKLIEEYVKNNNLDVKCLQSGLAYYITEEGTGTQVVNGSTATVHYTGKLLDGTKFDSSKDRNQPFPVQVGANRVIQGWEEGLTLFREGSKGTLIIPSGMGYGERSAGAVIKPNSVLVFDIEVLDVK